MAKKKEMSKYACDSSLFKPEPPITPTLVKQLFHGRAKELQRGIETLKSQLDIDGKQSKTRDKRPWVIHGESRSGKSHLARRIFVEMPENDRRIQLMIPAREKIEAVLVMGNLFRELLGHFRRRTQDQRLTEPVYLQPDVQLVDRLIDKMELFLNDVQSATLTTEQGSRSTLEVGGELTGLLGKFLAKYQSEQTDKATRQVVLKPPTASTLAQVCGVMVELLLRHKLIRHLLVLIDDVDLLEGFKSSEQNGRIQRSLLAEALCELHQAPGIDVVLTARSWYAYSTKDFHTLVDLTESQLQPEDLIVIHDRQMEVYAKKLGAERFLRLEALQEFVRDSTGLPGVFLQHLQTAFYAFQNEEDWSERDYEWFLNVFRRLFANYQGKCVPAAEMIRSAVEEGRLEMTVGSTNPFFGTVFDNLLVFQSYYNEQCYFTSPLVKRIFKSPIDASPPLPGSRAE
jgi:hypothetical protein